MAVSENPEVLMCLVGVFDDVWMVVVGWDVVFVCVLVLVWMQLR